MLTCAPWPLDVQSGSGDGGDGQGGGQWYDHVQVHEQVLP